MKGFFTKIFGRKELTEDDYKQLWQSISNKSIKAIQDTLFKITSSEYFISQLDKINLNTLEELNSFLNLFKSYTNNQIIDNIKADLNNFLLNSEFVIKTLQRFNIKYDKKLLFLNKNDFLEFLLDQANLDNNQDFKQFFQDYYINQVEYINNLISAHKTANSKLLKLYTQTTNYKSKLFEIFKDFKTIFKNNKHKSDIYTEEDWFLNLVINLDKTNIEMKAIEAILNTFNHKSIFPTLFLLKFYKLYKEIVKNNTNTNIKSILKQLKFLDFLDLNTEQLFSEPILSIFNNLSVETFEKLLTNLLSIVYQDEFSILPKQMQTIGYILFDNLIKSRANIKLVNSFISIFSKFNNQIQNFCLKILFENFSDSINSNKILLEILNNNSTVLNTGKISNELYQMIEILEIFQKYKIEFNLTQFISSEYLIKHKMIDFYNSLIFDTINQLFNRLSRNFSYNEYNFVDKYYSDIIQIINYFKKFENVDFADIIIKYIQKNQLESSAAKILNNNSNLIDNINQLETEIIINLFLDAKPTEKEKAISEFKHDLDNLLMNRTLQLDAKFKQKLTSLFRYFDIRAVFVDNQLKISELEMENINTNEVLDSFIAQKFTIENVKNIKDFMGKTIDIRNALNISNIDYLFAVFFLFMKHQKFDICEQILEEVIELDYNKFEELVNLSKRKSKDSNKFLKQSKFTVKLLEKTKDRVFLLENLTSIDFNKQPKREFDVNIEDIVMHNTVSFYLPNLKVKEIEINSLKLNNENNDLKYNLINYLTNVKSLIKTETNNIKFKITIHPNLLNILKINNIDISNQEFKFNNNIIFRSKIYRFILKQKLLSLNEILAYEAIEIDRNFNPINKNDTEAEFNLLKLLINIYTEELNDDFITFFENQKYSIRMIEELIVFLLSITKTFNIDNLIFVNKLLADNNQYKISEPNLFRLANTITKNKFNVLPFIDNFNSLSQNIINEIETLNRDQLDNINYFKTEAKNKSFTLQMKLQMSEIYNRINMNNSQNIIKICLILNQTNSYQIDANFLFVLKLFKKYSYINCFIFDQFKQPSISLTNILTTLPNESIAKILDELLYLPKLVNQIYEFRSILDVFDKDKESAIKCFFNNNLALIGQIITQHPSILNKFSVLDNKTRLFKLKQYIAAKISESDIISKYSDIRNAEDYMDHEIILGNNKRLKEELYNIYTQN